jgi:IS5 family transposase
VLEGIEATMFRTIGDGPSPWELLLPPVLLRLPEELARVDALLDDPVFFAPFAPYFHPVLGRPSTPVECLRGSRTRPPVLTWASTRPARIR